MFIMDFTYAITTLNLHTAGIVHLINMLWLFLTTRRGILGLKVRGVALCIPGIDSNHLEIEMYPRHGNITSQMTSLPLLVLPHTHAVLLTTDLIEAFPAKTPVDMYGLQALKSLWASWQWEHWLESVLWLNGQIRNIIRRIQKSLCWNIRCM